MVFMIKYHWILPNGRCSMYGVTLHKYQEHEKLPFNINDPISCYKFLKSKYGKYKLPADMKIAFRIYKWGGRYINFFPGYFKNGETMPLNKFGQLDLFPRLYQEVLEKEKMPERTKLERKKKHKEMKQYLMEGAL